MKFPFKQSLNTNQQNKIFFFLILTHSSSSEGLVVLQNETLVIIYTHDQLVGLKKKNENTSLTTVQSQFRRTKPDLDCSPSLRCHQTTFLLLMNKFIKQDMLSEALPSLHEPDE